jgi:hypothetical protein
MSKRFIDSNLFDDSWFMQLTKDGKLFWVYLLTKCNHAGIIDLNIQLCSFQTGIKDITTVIKELDNRLIRVKSDAYFIPKYLDFQYPNFPKSNVKQQASAILILENLGLMKDNIITVRKELVNSYDNDNDNVNDNGIIIKGEILKNWRTDFEIYKSELRESYKKILHDENWFKEKVKFHPNIDIQKTIDKSILEYWSLDCGWKNKKGKKTNDIDWKRTFNNILNEKRNHVYKPREITQGKTD